MCAHYTSAHKEGGGASLSVQHTHTPNIRLGMREGGCGRGIAQAIAMCNVVGSEESEYVPDKSICHVTELAEPCQVEREQHTAAKATCSTATTLQHFPSRHKPKCRDKRLNQSSQTTADMW